MAIHQANLHGSKRDQERTDEKAMRAFLAGEVDLAEGLGVDRELIEGLRRQAVALFETGKWDRCVQVVLGVVALGSVHPADAIMLSRCYDRLGRPAAADACRDHAERMMSAMGIEVPSIGGDA